MPTKKRQFLQNIAEAASRHSGRKMSALSGKQFDKLRRDTMRSTKSKSR